MTKTPHNMETPPHSATDDDLDVCPMCDGVGALPTGRALKLVDSSGGDHFKTCFRCKGDGLVRIHPTSA